MAEKVRVIQEIAKIIKEKQVGPPGPSSAANNIFDKVVFNKLAGVNVGEGEVAWNLDEDTLDIGQHERVLQLGQELGYFARNGNAGLIANGTPVMATGTIGASGRLVFDYMDGTSSANAKLFLGIVTEDFDSGEDGHVTSFGKIRGIDTTGTLSFGGAETWNEGDILYIDPVNVGYLTNVAPSPPDLSLAIAFVVSVHALVGTIYVRATTLNENAIGGGGGGDVTKVGTPVDNELAVWTGDGTLEGEANLTYAPNLFTVNSAALRLDSGRPLQFGGLNTTIYGSDLTDNLSLRINSNEVVEVNANGIDVTGDVTADGVTLTGDQDLTGYAQLGVAQEWTAAQQFNNNIPIDFGSDGNVSGQLLGASAGRLSLLLYNDFVITQGVVTERFRLDVATGDLTVSGDITANGVTLTGEGSPHLASVEVPTGSKTITEQGTVFYLTGAITGITLPSNVTDFPAGAMITIINLHSAANTANGDGVNNLVEKGALATDLTSVDIDASGGTAVFTRLPSGDWLVRGDYA